MGRACARGAGGVGAAGDGVKKPHKLAFKQNPLQNVFLLLHCHVFHRHAQPRRQILSIHV